MFCLMTASGMIRFQNLVKIYLNFLLFSGELQDIKDILRYTSHSDPHLKGNAAVVIGYVIRAGLIEGRGSFDKWIQKESNKG